MIFYEAPHKLIYTLKDMFEYFGDRQIAICREITKLHEQVINTTLSAAIEKYELEPPKGEFVLVIKGKEPVQEKEYTLEEAVELAKSFVEDGLATSAAAKQAATQTGLKKSDIYKQLCN